MTTTKGLLDAAREHLRLLRAAHSRQDYSDRYYVTLAYSYGLTTGEIADVSGMALEDVQRILVGV